MLPQVGDKCLFQTVGHWYLGEVTHSSPSHVTIKNASQVFETGPYSEFFGKGVIKYSERLPDGWNVPMPGVAWGPWEHALPKKANGV